MLIHRVLLPLAFFAMLCSGAIAAESNRAMTVENDIAYVPKGDPAQVLDLYIPTKPSKGPLPLIVWIHGGGWIGGSKANPSALNMLSSGYAVASVEYRFSTVAKFPAQIQDCQAAIRWLRANSRKYNIDPDHIGVMGQSAGGHLSALLGTAGGANAFPPIGGNEKVSDRVQAVVDMCGPADFRTVMQQAAADPTKSGIRFNTASDYYSNLIGAKLGEDDKSDAVSPVHYVDKKDAPFLILHGTLDPIVPFAQSAELADALKKAGVNVVFQKLPGTNHAGPGFGFPAVRALISKFFDKNLKGANVKVDELPDSALVPRQPAQ